MGFFSTQAVPTAPNALLPMALPPVWERASSQRRPSAITVVPVRLSSLGWTVVAACSWDGLTANKAVGANTILSSSQPRRADVFCMFTPVLVGAAPYKPFL